MTTPRDAPAGALDPAAGQAAALRARRERAAVKQAIRSGRSDALDVAETAWAHPDSVEHRLRVTELLGSLQGLGPVGVAAAMTELGIASSKRVGGLGTTQRAALRTWLQDRSARRRSGSRLVVLAGPTAVGKGTVAQAVRERYPDVRHSVSWTTRAPRPGEIDGVHYRFVDDEAFDALVAERGFLEWALVHNSYRYGTPRQAVLDTLESGHSVLLEIDLAGARQVRASMPDALLVFLAPPSWDELVRRLVGRGTEGAEERARRLETARVELASQGEFDVVIVNRDVHKAAAELVQHIRRG